MNSDSEQISAAMSEPSSAPPDLSTSPSNIYIYTALAILFIAVIYILFKPSTLNNTSDNSLIRPSQGNSVTIPATGGLYYTIPAYIMLVPINQTNGIISWKVFNSLARGCYLKDDDATQIICPYIGLYEVTLNGSAACNSPANAITMFVNSQKYIDGVYNSSASWTSVGFSSFINITSANTYVQYSISGDIAVQENPPLICTIKFISTNI